MNYRLYSYRHGLDILETVPEYQTLWSELTTVLDGISDQRIAEHFGRHGEGRSKSISIAINHLIDEDLSAAGWLSQAKIFGQSDYGDNTWRLDFAKDVYIVGESVDRVDAGVLLTSDQPERALLAPGGASRPTRERSGVSVEVAFNHGSTVAWNLIKPVIASEINHVPKEIQTGVGIIVAATDAMKTMGGFDKAVGSYEMYVNHLLPLRTLLTVPLVIVGLEPCSTFRIRHEKDGKNYRGYIEWVGEI